MGRIIETIFKDRRPAPGRITHSDRSSQCGSREYLTLLARHGIKVCLRVNPCANAWMNLWTPSKKRCFKAAAASPPPMPAPNSSPTSKPTSDFNMR